MVFKCLKTRLRSDWDFLTLEADVNAYLGYMDDCGYVLKDKEVFVEADLVIVILWFGKKWLPPMLGYVITEEGMKPLG